MHAFTIQYTAWHRTTRRMSGLQCATVHARSPWGALRAWWRVQRQWHPLVSVRAIEPRHSSACVLELSTTWAYACDYV